MKTGQIIPPRDAQSVNLGISWDLRGKWRPASSLRFECLVLEPRGEVVLLVVAINMCGKW